MSNQERENQNFEDRIKRLEEVYTDIQRLLKPISETYQTVSKLGKWSMAVMVFASVLIGILLGLKSLK